MQTVTGWVEITFYCLKTNHCFGKHGMLRFIICKKHQSQNTMKIIENGALRCGVQFATNISRTSVITQRIFVEAEASAVLFESDVDWNEKYKVLKVQFPLNIRSSVCHYDIQFGFVQRPTVMNSTQDIAKFEVVGHKFADLSRISR
eukprot:947887_1